MNDLITFVIYPQIHCMVHDKWEPGITIYRGTDKDPAKERIILGQTFLEETLKQIKELEDGPRSSVDKPPRSDQG